MTARYVKNPFPDELPPALSADELWERVCPLLRELDGCARHQAVPRSTGQYQRNYSIYTGLGGVAVAFLRVGLHCRDVRDGADAATAATGWLQRAHALAVVCAVAGGREEQCVSFYCGTAGALAVACVAAHALGHARSRAEHLRALLALAPGAETHAEDEILFGKAGWMYCLQFIQRSLGDGVDEWTARKIESSLQRTGEALVARGREVARERGLVQKGWPLMWECFGDLYLGAAHGAVGCLASLYRSFALLAPASREAVDATLAALLATRHASGNLPIKLGSRRDEHIHWCHGAPGLPSLFHAAAEARGDDDGALRAAAERAAEQVWERGLLLKGLSLCHGLAGNAYAFLALARWTRDDVQLARAHAFASMMRDERYLQLIAQQDDPQRRVRGVPDSPASLMEGTAGVVCFLLDLARGSDAAGLPGWDL